jgi:kynureninase
VHFSQQASHLDATDPLASFRERFVIEDDYIYLDGNSLGRLPKDTITRTREAVESEWATQLVLGWDTWLDVGTRLGDRLAPLIGAQPGEVAVADQTSVNLYKLAAAAVSASGRTNIVTDRGNFPSDRYVLGSIAEAAGGRLIVVPEDPTLGEIELALDDTVGLVSFSHVSYRSGAMADGRAVTDLVHGHGAFMLWDLAHSAGSVPVDLTDWNADLGVGCTYKYLNAGPGAPGFLYVRGDLQTKLQQPIAGWYGHADQFGFAEEWQAAHDIRRFVVGTPPVTSMMGVEVGIELTTEAGIGPLREKSIALSEFFIDALTPIVGMGATIVTPLDPHQRGSHITIRHVDGYQISSALRDRGVIPDFRAPDLIRFGFTPLYTTFTEALAAAKILADIMVSGSYKSLPSSRTGVT